MIRWIFSLSSAFLFVLCIQVQVAWAADAAPAPLDVSVFFSKDDPYWLKTEAVIDAVGKAFPRLRIAKISMDDDSGYRQLNEIEKRWRIDPTGDITFAMGPYHLTSQGSRRGIEKYLHAMVVRILTPGKIKGRKQPDVKKFAVEWFGPGVEVHDAEEAAEAAIRYYRVSSAGKTAGWIADAHQDIRCPVCNDTQFLVALGVPDLNIIEVKPVWPLERMGLILDQKEMDAYLGQFTKAWRPDSNRKVDIVSGATKTSNAYLAALTEILAELGKRVKMTNP